MADFTLQKKRFMSLKTYQQKLPKINTGKNDHQRAVHNFKDSNMPVIGH